MDDLWDSTTDFLRLFVHGASVRACRPDICYVLVIRALLKYLRSGEVRKEKAETKKTLGEALKAHRTRCNMTQEFVAESLGVSRQAVSKWESGASDPSTSNLLALAKLYGVSAEELLREAAGTQRT